MSRGTMDAIQDCAQTNEARFLISRWYREILFDIVFTLLGIPEPTEASHTLGCHYVPTHLPMMALLCLFINDEEN